jgi:8-oxo-dGTP pyrophosphatase MutT (NUDIX family)
VPPSPGPASGAREPAGGATGLHADAVGTLTAWTAPDGDQERLRSEFLEHLARHHDGLSRACVPAHLTASALVVDAAREHVLLVRHRKGGFWVQPGGHCEPTDRTLADAALREATEESGISGLGLAMPDPVDLDRHRLSAAFGTCGEHLDVRFLVVAPPEADPVASDEADEARWFSWDAVPADAVEDLGRLLARGRAASAPSPAAEPAAGQSTSASGRMSSPDAAATPSR